MSLASNVYSWSAVILQVLLFRNLRFQGASLLDTRDKSLTPASTPCQCVSMFKPKDSSLPLYILGLLDRQASLMVTVGSTPSHRLGTIRLCGLHLRSLLVVHGSSLLPRQEPAVVQPALPPVLSEVDFWAPYGLSLEPTFEWMNFDNDGMFGMGDSFDIDLN